MSQMQGGIEGRRERGRKREREAARENIDELKREGRAGGAGTERQASERVKHEHNFRTGMMSPHISPDTKK